MSLNRYTRCAVVLLSGSLLACGVGVGGKPDPRWQAHSANALTRGDCGEASRVLRANRHVDDRKWFETRAEVALQCSTGSDRRSSIREAVRELDTAVSRWPRSARLLYLRGFLLTVAGDASKADADFVRAEEVAQQNLSGTDDSDPEGDRRVLRLLKKDRKALGR